MKKRILSMLLSVCMLSGLIVVIPTTNVSAATTITDEALFMTYPTYLSNSEMDEGLSKAEAAYYAVINSYSDSDETVAAFMTSMSEGVSILVKEGLANLGIGETLYETQAREAATKYMQSMLTNENVIKKASGMVDKAYKTLKTSYSIASNVDKTTMMADLYNVAAECDIGIKPDDMDDLVNNLYDSGSLKTDLAAIGEANNLWKIVFEFTEIHAIEKTTLDLLMDELSKSGQTGSDLYLGLSLLKGDMEKDCASYVLKYYATDKAVSYLADKADDLIGAVTSANAVSLVTTFMKVFANYIYVNAKAEDITQAIMQTSFVSSIDICLSQYRLKFLQGTGTTADIETYESLYAAYLSAYKTCLDSCYDVAKIDDKFSLGGDCMVWSSNIESLYTYDKYIEWCKEEIAHDIENSELDKTTGSSTITDALNEETIADRIDRVLRLYPAGSKWTGEFNGTKSSLGYAGKVFNMIFDKQMGSKVENDYQYILTSNKNVRLIGRLEEEAVTENALKELFANVRIGDVVITSGQYDYLHAMTVIGMGENGPIVYDVDSKYGPAEEYTHLIQQYEFPYSKMAEAFSENGKYLTKPGISVYRAIKKVNTTNSGTSLYYEEYDDSVNYIIEDGVLTGYKGSRTTIEIPDGVTSIAANCFKNNTSIKYVYMPDTITVIDDSAFYGCRNLIGVEFSDNLENIYESAFYNCDSLRGIVVPGSPQIHGDAFDYCSKLENIILSKNITHISCGAFDNTLWYEEHPEGMVYINDVLYDYKYVENRQETTVNGVTYTTTTYSPLPEDVDLVVREGTKAICSGAIKNYHNSLYLPETLEYMGSVACDLDVLYYNPINLSNNSYFFISHPFENRSIKEIHIGENVQLMDSFFFWGINTEDLNTLRYNATNYTDYMMHFWDKYPNLTNIILGENVKTIPDYAFGGTPIQKIRIPDSVTKIGDCAFAGTELEEVHIPKGVEEANFNSIFRNCKKLKKVTVDSGNAKYEAIDGVVYDKIENELNFIPQGIETFTVPNNILKENYEILFSGEICSIHGEDKISVEPELDDTYILNWIPPRYPNLCNISAKEDNHGLNSKEGILYNGNNLSIYPAKKVGKEYTTPNNLYSIQPGAFSGNDYLEYVCIESDNYYTKYEVYDIWMSNWFAECSNLKYVDFRISETKLGDGLFYNCQNLEGVGFPDGLKEIRHFVFAGCTKLETIEIPEGVTSIGLAAFANCKSLTGLYLPNTIQKVDDLALAGCTSLKDIYYGGTKEEWEEVYVSTDLEDVKIHFNCKGLPGAEITDIATSVEDANNTTINLSVSNAPANSTIYIASFDDLGRLVELKTSPLTDGIATATFLTDNVSEFKAFIWKDGIKPVAEAKECKLQ